MEDLRPRTAPPAVSQLPSPEGRDIAQEFQELESICLKCPSESFQERLLNFPSACTFFSNSKNRYSNILPNEATRVKLRELPGQSGSDYINANHILASRSYVATQAPLPNTMCDFWRMIWEQRSPAIVMITRLYEGGKLKAHQYWPDDADPEPTVYGCISVTNVSFIPGEHFDTRVLRLTYHLPASPRHPSQQNTLSGSVDELHSSCGSIGAPLSPVPPPPDGSDEVRYVSHYHYQLWPDFGVPNSTLGIRILIDTVRSHMHSYNTTGGPALAPLVVHCSAGVGRSGAFIAIYHAVERAHKGLPTHVMELVMELRHCRAGMVQTKEQYAFIVHCLADYFDEQHKANSPTRKNSEGRAKLKRSLDDPPRLGELTGSGLHPPSAPMPSPRGAVPPPTLSGSAHAAGLAVSSDGSAYCGSDPASPSVPSQAAAAAAAAAVAAASAAMTDTPNTARLKLSYSMNNLQSLA